MSDGFPVALVGWTAVAWIAALAVMVVWKLLTGGIDLGQLLQGDQADGSTYFSPGRAQLLVFTVLFAVHLWLQVMAHPGEFPVIPREYLAVLGGSQAVYLVGKARAMLR